MRIEHNKEEGKEVTSLTFSGKDVADYMNSHGLKDMYDTFEGFRNDCFTLLTSMCNLYEANLIPLVCLGVKVDMTITVAGKKYRMGTVGSDELLNDKLKGAWDDRKVRD